MNELIREQLHELVDIVIDTNGLEDRKRELTGTLPTMFMDYCGHINQLEIQMSIDGWMPGVSSKRILTWNMDEPLSDATIRNLRNVCEQAREDKKESEILARDIVIQTDKVTEEKETLAKMKKKLAKLTKEGK